jgi:trans-aconitate methyltransferase
VSDEDQINYGAVRRYFAQAGRGEAASASYMAHAQDLPENAVRYRFRRECATIRDWVDSVRPQARVLDLGCGAGAWAERFAERFASVVAIEQSSAMLAAARARLASRSNVELLNRDVRDPLPSGPFDLVFIGGLCMYLNNADAIALVRAVVSRLSVRGRVVLRESTIAVGSECTEGAYRAIYRSVDVYRALFLDAGISRVDVRRNHAYTDMEIAVELVEMRRRHLRVLPHTSPFLGALTWWSLRVASPACFRILPRAGAWLGVRWPRLQNHFFLLQGTS